MMRWLKILMGISGMLSLVVIRDKYILNFLNRDLPFLLRRDVSDLSSYSLDFQSTLTSFFADPRWLSTGFFLVAMESLSIFILYAYFRKTYVVKVAFLFYALLVGVAVLCVLTSLVLHNYEVGYKAAQSIKNLLQVPTVLLILFPIFYFIEKTRSKSSQKVPKKA